ncbi:hypothetical protein HPB48_005922 [Haemaphysalis longicornis]|uniref:UBC core domain-containing protein n=1 Tax=Haemaphysalis longicornis TaxID=44386 RepID=A0A9J6FMP9_HAELO|nr:hypothetical protein HPB48_005922 [Haemaphysalis longicornis]
MQKEPIPGVSVDVDNVGSDLTQWTVDMEGAKGTLYEGEKFQLTFKFSLKYPFQSPEVTFVEPNVPVHPHVYSNGHICLSILGDGWSPCPDSAVSLPEHHLHALKLQKEGVVTATVLTLKEGDRAVSAKSCVKAAIPADTGRTKAKITTKLVFCTTKKSLSCFARINNMPLNNPCMTYVHHRWIWLHQIICYTEPFFSH